MCCESPATSKQKLERLELFEAYFKDVGNGCVIDGLAIAQNRTLKLMAEELASGIDTHTAFQDMAMDTLKYVDLLENLIKTHGTK